MKNISIALLLLLNVMLFAQPTDKITVAVLDLKVAGVADYFTTILSDKMRSELGKIRIYNVINRENMAEIMGEQAFQNTGTCTSDRCVVEIGRVLGVEKMITGSVGKLGNTFVLTVKQIDVETGSNEKVVTKSVRGGEEQLLDMVEQSIDELKNITKEKQIVFLKQDLLNKQVRIDSLNQSLKSIKQTQNDLKNQLVKLSERKKIALANIEIRRNNAINQTNINIKKVELDNISIKLLNEQKSLEEAKAEIETYKGQITDLNSVKEKHLTRLEYLNSINTTTKTIVRSALCPGLGQYKSGRKWQGITYGSLVIAGIGYYALSVSDYNSKVDDYKTALDDYNNSKNPDKLNKLNGLKSKIDDAEKLPYIAIGIIAGAYLWNIADAAWFTPEDSRIQQLKVKPELGVGFDGKVRAGLCFNF